MYKIYKDYNRREEDGKIKLTRVKFSMTERNYISLHITPIEQEKGSTMESYSMFDGTSAPFGHMKRKNAKLWQEMAELVGNHFDDMYTAFTKDEEISRAESKAKGENYVFNPGAGNTRAVVLPLLQEFKAKYAAKIF